MPKRLATFPWLVIASLPMACLAACCGPELDERVQIPNSQWVVSTQLFSCGGLDGGRIEIFAEESASKERVDILELGFADHTHVEYLGDNRVQISLPNLALIESQHFSFGPYKIIYLYLPSDDPEERANYQRWLKNPNDPAAKKWHEENIMDKFHPAAPRPNE